MDAPTTPLVPGLLFWRLPAVLAELSPVDRAIRIMGTQALLGAALGLTDNAVPGWRRRRHVPAHHHLRIEELTGGLVDARELLLWNDGVDHTYPIVLRHYAGHAAAREHPLANGHGARAEVGMEVAA